MLMTLYGNWLDWDYEKDLVRLVEYFEGRDTRDLFFCNG
jgi:hypothetical protein